MNLSKTELLKIVKEIIGQLNTSYNPEAIDMNENLFTAGVLDSLLLLQFVIGLEEKLGLRFRNNQITYDNFKNIEAIANLIAQKQQAQK